MKKKVTQILRTLAFPPHLLGYEYMRTAILLCLDDETLIHKVTKSLYPQIAELHSTTTCKVERAIRHSIQISIRNAPIEDLVEYICVSSNNSGRIPTNSEYIASIVDVLRVDMEE